MKKDKRYELVQALFKIGHIKQFQDIFNIVPKTVLSRDLGFNYVRFTRCLRHPTRFTVKEIILIGYLTGIPALQLLKWIIESTKSIK